MESVDLELKENGKCHSTHDYEPMERPQNGQLVVRRGQVFQVRHVPATAARRAKIGTTNQIIAP